MNKNFYKIINMFYSNKKKYLLLLCIFSIFTGLFEFLGLILIFQFVIFLINPTSLNSNKIIDFFTTNFHIINFSKISLILGISIAFIYIIKNIYLIFYTQFSNNILVDLSKKINLKAINIFLFYNFNKINQLAPESKLNILSKIDITVWQYCLKYLNFYSNLIVTIIILLYLYIKFLHIAIIASILVLFFGGIEYLFLKKKSKFKNDNYSKAIKEYNSVLLKIIYLIKEIKISSKEKHFINQIKKTYDKMCNISKAESIDSVIHIYITEILFMITFAIILLVLFYTSNFNNQIIISSICTICIVILRTTPLLNRMQSCLYTINANKKIVNEVIEFFEKFSDKITTIQNSEKINFSNSIELKNICFKYDNQNYGLENINLKINKGEFIGIVGRSGCYKTTLLNIISGLIDIQKGNIYIDSKKLSKENIKAWQNNISYVSQEHQLMFDIVMENFESNNEINENKIFSIFKELDIEKDLIYTQELKLSQGQKQRIALAISLYQNKNILLLDEITSSIDVLSEDKINNLLSILKGDKTIISIAHRLQILKHCDKIIYMDNAKIIDFDTFENLDKKYTDFHKIIELSNFNL